MICTSECEYCAYGTVDDNNKAIIKINCSMKNKTYYYGQYVPCDYFEDDGRRVQEMIDNADESNTDIQIKTVKRKRGRPKGSKNKEKVKV